MTLGKSFVAKIANIHITLFQIRIGLFSGYGIKPNPESLTTSSLLTNGILPHIKTEDDSETNPPSDTNGVSSPEEASAFERVKDYLLAFYRKKIEEGILDTTTNNETESDNVLENSQTTSTNDYKCIFCSRTFDNLPDLQLHFQEHSNLPEQYSCNICFKEFKVKKNYETHMLNHEDVSDDVKPAFELDDARSKRVQCPICNKWFVSQSSLRLHMPAHTGEKQYQCDICEKFFVRKSDMVRHHKAHSQLEPFQCTECDSYYTRKNKLVLHFRKVHPDLPLPNFHSAEPTSTLQMSDNPFASSPFMGIDSTLASLSALQSALNNNETLPGKNSDSHEEIEENSHLSGDVGSHSVENSHLSGPAGMFNAKNVHLPAVMENPIEENSNLTEPMASSQEENSHLHEKREKLGENIAKQCLQQVSNKGDSSNDDQMILEDNNVDDFINNLKQEVADSSRITGNKEQERKAETMEFQEESVEDFLSSFNKDASAADS